jgi:hypothetical protein
MALRAASVDDRLFSERTQRTRRDKKRKTRNVKLSIDKVTWLDTRVLRFTFHALLSVSSVALG